MTTANDTTTPARVTTRHYGPGVIIGVAADNDQDILVKLDTATSYGAQTVWQARSEVEVMPVTCQIDACIQDATHGNSCCYHFGECGCTDDDLADAMAENAQGTYNGYVPTYDTEPTFASRYIAPMVIPNNGLHLTQYTVVTSQPGQTFTSVVKILCDECRSKTSGASKMGEVVNGFCDGCGVGPSVSHFRLIDPPGDNPLGDEEGDPTPPDRPRCAACDTTDYVMSSTIPGLCLGCSNARYWGFASRLEAEPHAWVLPVPILYCSSCLCVAEQLDANAWRCRNPQCLSAWPRDELLTTSELIKRRAALERIGVAVMTRPTCTACGGSHSVQKCPELWSELRADPTLGARLMGLWWKKHASFIAMIVNADDTRRRHYAYSWVAFLRTYSPHTTLTAYRMLARWAHEMDPEPTPVAMELAA